MSHPKFVLKERAVPRFQSAHPWIYGGEIATAEPAESGEVVSVCDPRGRQLAFAFYSASSRIALRIISRDQAPDAGLYRRRIEQAIELRRRIDPERSMERLVHGESDGLPSIIVDRYGDVVVIQTLSAGAERLKPLLIDLLAELLHPKTIVERNDPGVRKLEGLPAVAGVVWGEPVAEHWCRENGLAVKVLPLTGQKTGLFLDQQENHAAAAAYARGRVLDAFSYQGGFALQASRHAESVEAVDASAEALAGLRANCDANGIRNIALVEANVFDRLTELSRGHERFDMVILDPPAFAKNRSAIEGAVRGYKEINLRAMSLLGPGGILVTSSCSYHLGELEFLGLLSEAALDQGRACQLIEKRTQARDHPILLSMPESYYLKCMILRML